MLLKYLVNILESERVTNTYLTKEVIVLKISNNPRESEKKTENDWYIIYLLNSVLTSYIFMHGKYQV